MAPLGAPCPLVACWQPQNLSPLTAHLSSEMRSLEAADLWAVSGDAPCRTGFCGSRVSFSGQRGCHVGRSPRRRHHSRPLGPPASGASDPASTSQLTVPYMGSLYGQAPLLPQALRLCWDSVPRSQHVGLAAVFPPVPGGMGPGGPGLGLRASAMESHLPGHPPPPREGRHPGGAGAWPLALVMDSEGPPPFPGSPHSADLAPE